MRNLKKYLDTPQRQMEEQNALHEIFDIMWPVEETPPPKLPDEVIMLEKSMIRGALNDCGQNRTKAAKRLGISRENLIYKIKKYKI